MNRSFHRFLGCLEIDVISLFGNAAIGATGACTLDTTNSKGISTIVRNSAGKYTVTLTEPVQKFLWADGIILDSAADDPTSAGVLVRIFSQAVTNTTTPTVVFQFYKASDGTAVDPASGAIFYFKMELRNSSVG